MATRPNFFLKQGEAKTLKFTVENKSDGSVLSLTDATLTFGAELQNNPQGLDIDKQHSDFTITDAALGIALLPLSASDTNLEPGDYRCELKIEFSVENISKSVDIDMKITDAVTA